MYPPWTAPLLLRPEDEVVCKADRVLAATTRGLFLGWLCEQSVCAVFLQSCEGHIVPQCRVQPAAVTDTEHTLTVTFCIQTVSYRAEKRGEIHRENCTDPQGILCKCMLKIS